MRGEEMWEQGLFGDFIAPSIAYAPPAAASPSAASCFAARPSPTSPSAPIEVSAQTVVVYQTGTGKQLLRADCSPVERAGQNFALSPNGLALAVVHDDAIEIYNLPPLTTKDESDLKLAHSIAPPENNLPVHFIPARPPLRRRRRHASPSPNSPPAATMPPLTPADPPLPIRPRPGLRPDHDSDHASATRHSSDASAPSPAAPPTPTSPSAGDTPPDRSTVPHPPSTPCPTTNAPPPAS